MTLSSYAFEYAPQSKHWNNLPFPCRALNIEMQDDTEAMLDDYGLTRRNTGGFISVQRCNFTDNSGRGPGGAIHLYQLSGHSSVKIKDCVFANNRVNCTLQPRSETISGRFSICPWCIRCLTKYTITRIFRLSFIIYTIYCLLPFLRSVLNRLTLFTGVVRKFLPYQSRIWEK